MRDTWGDSLSWLNIDSTGMMTGYVPSYFDEGGGNVIASIVDENGNQNEIQSSFFTVEPRFDKRLRWHMSELAMIGQTQWLDSSVLFNTSNKMDILLRRNCICQHRANG